MTYRISSHVGPEDNSYIYRPEDEVKQWERLCPITNFEKLISDRFDINKDEMVQEIAEEISDAFKIAKKSNFFKVENWESLNFSNKSNKQLKTEENKDSSLHDSDTLPGPY